MLSLKNPFHTLTSYSFKIHFNIIFSSGFLTRLLYAFFIFPYVCYIYWISHLPSF